MTCAVLLLLLSMAVGVGSARPSGPPRVGGLGGAGVDSRAPLKMSEDPLERRRACIEMRDRGVAQATARGEEERQVACQTSLPPQPALQRMP